MARTYRQLLEHIAETAAEATLHRAGQSSPTDTQRRAAVRCAMRHAVQTIATDDPATLIALRDGLAAERHLTHAGRNRT